MTTEKQIKKARDKIVQFAHDFDTPPYTRIARETEIVLETLEWVLRDNKKYKG